MDKPNQHLVDLIAKREELDAHAPELRGSYEIFQARFAEFVQLNKQFQQPLSPAAVPISASRLSTTGYRAG